MTRTPIPPALAAISYPWHLTDEDERRKATKQLRPDSAQRTAALDALNQCLAYKVDEHSRWDEPQVSLPDDFYDSWILYARSFTDRMPTLDDVTLDTVRVWMTEEMDPAVFGMQWTAPPPDYVEEVARSWARGAIGQLLRSLIRWLKGAVRQPDAAHDRIQMLAAVQAAIPRVNEYYRVTMLDTVADLATAEAAIEFFTRIENDENLDHKTRQEAKELRELRERALAQQTP